MKYKRTKIIATIGPACADAKTILQMVKAGTNVARLNFSHGIHDEHAMMIERLRQVEKDSGEPLAILQDLQGPKIRIGVLPEDGVELAKGATVVFDTSVGNYDEKRIPVDYGDLHNFIKKGERLFIADGKIETRITNVERTALTAEVIVGGRVSSHKGINVPDTHLEVRAMTDKDDLDLAFGVAHDVDMVAVSFVRTADDIAHVRARIVEHEKTLGKRPDQPIAIIAKIERREALDNIEKILDVADGIMVARGDLGVEVSAVEVPIIQKRLIRLALERGKPVIVATQMLDSMQENPRATRAEVSDVANAVIDHTDATMLSNETATGKYPVEAVETMVAIIAETEESHYDDLPISEETKQPKKKDGKRIENAVSSLSRLLAERVDAKAIVAASFTGGTGRMISRCRPELPIFVATASPRTARQLNLSWGVLPFLLLPCETIEELVHGAFAALKREKQIAKGDTVVVVAGEPVGAAGHVNVLEVREVE